MGVPKFAEGNPFSWCDDHTHKTGTNPSVSHDNCQAPKRAIQISNGQVYLVYDRKLIPSVEDISDDDCIRLIEHGVQSHRRSAVVVPQRQLPEMPPPTFVSPTAEAAMRQRAARVTNVSAANHSIQQRGRKHVVASSFIDPAGFRVIMPSRQPCPIHRQARKKDEPEAAAPKLAVPDLGPDFSLPALEAYTKIFEPQHERKVSEQADTGPVLQHLNPATSTKGPRMTKQTKGKCRSAGSAQDAGAHDLLIFSRACKDAEQKKRAGLTQPSTTRPTSAQTQSTADGFENVSLEEDGVDSESWAKSSLSAALDVDEAKEWQEILTSRQAGSSENGKNDLKGARGWFWRPREGCEGHGRL